jgi:hypothetical protein
MPRVTYLGSAASYTRNGKRWTKSGPSIEVDAAEWEALRKTRSDANQRLFMLDDSDVVDDEINAMADGLAAGNFITKQSALDYVRDMMDVELDSNVSLEQLNQQTMFLKERYDVGRRGDALIEGVRGATALSPDGDVEVEDHAQTGEIDTAMEAAKRSRHTQETVEDRMAARRENVSVPDIAKMKAAKKSNPLVVRQGAIRTISSEGV